MRISVTFEVDRPVRTPINQNYFLASAIYKAIESRPDYARFLHDYGYEHYPSRRRFKLFVFSPMLSKRREVRDESIVFGPGRIRWIISSPMADFVTALAEGLLSEGVVDIRGEELVISMVETEPEPEITERMSFTCLSPIVVSRPAKEKGYPHYCTNEDPDFTVRVRNNLIRKYELIYGRLPDDTHFDLTFDPDYISRKEGRVTKLIDIRGTLIRGVMCPFTAIGSAELMKTAYECGAGQHGSMGFGCLDITCL